HVLIPYCAVLLLVPASRRERLLAAFALAILLPLIVVYLRYTVESKPPIAVSFTGQIPLLRTVLFSSDFMPVAWIVAWRLGLVLGLRRRAAWVAVVILIGLDVAWRWMGIYSMFVSYERQVASARYESILLVPFVIGMALLMQAVPSRRTWVRASLLAIFLA